jgi:hypothetical protein
MTNPEIITISEGQSVKILTNVTNISLKMLSSEVFYYATYRLTGDETEISDNEKYKIFQQSNNYKDDFLYPIDFYIYCKNSDNDNNEVGKIRVDYAENNGNQNVLSFSKNAVLSTTYADNEIVKGNGFQLHRIITVPTGGKKLVVDFSNLTDGFVFTLPLIMKTNEGQCWVNTYVIQNYTGGTDITPTRRNSTVENYSEVTVKDGVTSSDVAGDTLRQYIVGALSTNQNAGGGISTTANIKIFGKNIIMFDIQNKESKTIYLELNFNWFEI